MGGGNCEYLRETWASLKTRVRRRSASKIERDFADLIDDRADQLLIAAFAIDSHAIATLQIRGSIRLQ